MKINESISFSILKEDYENSTKDYTDINNCPFAIAFRRQISNSLISVGVCRAQTNDKEFYILRQVFDINEYKSLAQGKEFHTQITRIY